MHPKARNVNQASPRRVKGDVAHKVATYALIWLMATVASLTMVLAIAAIVLTVRGEWSEELLAVQIDRNSDPTRVYIQVPAYVLESVEPQVQEIIEITEPMERKVNGYVADASPVIEARVQDFIDTAEAMERYADRAAPVVETKLQDFVDNVEEIAEDSLEIIEPVTAPIVEIVVDQAQDVVESTEPVQRKGHDLVEDATPVVIDTVQREVNNTVENATPVIENVNERLENLMNTVWVIESLSKAKPLSKRPCVGEPATRRQIEPGLQERLSRVTCD